MTARRSLKRLTAVASLAAGSLALFAGPSGAAPAPAPATTCLPAPLNTVCAPV